MSIYHDYLKSEREKSSLKFAIFCLEALECSTISMFIYYNNFQAHFVHGIAAYHLGWIKQALESFQQGQSLAGELVVLCANHMRLHIESAL